MTESTTKEFVKNIRDILEVMSDNGKFHRTIMTDACDRLEQQQTCIRDLVAACEVGLISTNTVLTMANLSEKKTKMPGTVKVKKQIEEAIAKAEELLKGV